MLNHKERVTKGRKGSAAWRDMFSEKSKSRPKVLPLWSRGQKGRSTGAERSGGEQETMMFKMRTWGRRVVGHTEAGSEKETLSVRSRKRFN